MSACNFLVFVHAVKALGKSHVIEVFIILLLNQRNPRHYIPMSIKELPTHADLFILYCKYFQGLGHIPKHQLISTIGPLSLLHPRDWCLQTYLEKCVVSFNTSIGQLSERVKLCSYVKWSMLFTDPSLLQIWVS